ncbi:MAG: hypothetical protein ACO1G9_15315 [Bacteroidota bacterium]
MDKSTLIDAIKENAKYFLEEAGDFFPFAVCVNDEDQFVPLYLNEEEEFPDEESMIAELKFCVTKAIDDDSFINGAIAYYETVNKDDLTLDCVRVLFFDNNKQQTTEDFTYSIKNKKVVFH